MIYTDSMLPITPTLFLPLSEVKLSFIRSSGPGGQNVNKVSTAVQLRFNVVNSKTLSATVKQRLIKIIGKNLTKEGDIMIKATEYRTQERNKRDALQRLVNLIKRATVTPKKRKKTKPSLASKERRLNNKKQRSKIKALRREKH